MWIPSRSTSQASARQEQPHLCLTLTLSVVRVVAPMAAPSARMAPNLEAVVAVGEVERVVARPPAGALEVEIRPGEVLSLK